MWDFGNVEAKKLNKVGDIHYTGALRNPYPGMKRGRNVKLYRHLALRPFKQANSHRLVLLLRGDRVSVEMNLVWMTMSKVLVRSI